MTKRKKPTITGASVPRKKAMVIKGDTGLYDAINEGEQKADIVNGIRMVSDNMKRKEGGERVIVTRKRILDKPKRMAAGTRQPIDKRRAGEHYDPFHEERVNDLVEGMVDYIYGGIEDET